MIILLALVSVIGISFGTFTFFQRAATEEVYVYNCGIIDFKPTSLTPYCADAGVIVGNIEWDKWGAEKATGVGQYAVNLCKPTCTDGTWKIAKVEIVLTKSVVDNGKKVLSRIDIVTSDKTNLPQRTSPRYGWDLEAKLLP